VRAYVVEVIEFPLLFLQPCIHKSLGMLHFEHVLHGEDIIFPPLNSAAFYRESGTGANGKDDCRHDTK